MTRNVWFDIPSDETLDKNITYVQCKLSLRDNRLLLECDYQDCARSSFVTSV